MDQGAFRGLMFGTMNSSHRNYIHSEHCITIGNFECIEAFAY